MSLRVLVVQDDGSLSAALQLGSSTVVVDRADGVAQALGRLATAAYDVLLLPVEHAGTQGLHRLQHLHAGLVLLRAGDGAVWTLLGGAPGGGPLAAAVAQAVRARRSGSAPAVLQSDSLLDAVDAPTCSVRADGRIVTVNRAWRAYAQEGGGRPEDTQEGANYLAACDAAAIGSAGTLDAADAGDVAAGLRAVLAGTSQRYQHDYPCHAPALQCWYSVRVSPAQVDGARGAVVSHVDVTAMHEVQEALWHQALHDPLTGLPNRLLLIDRLDHALAQSSRREGVVGVAFLDVDHFKRINDSLGHAAGDALLQQVGERLEGHLRSGDTLARLSGDEFVVVWGDVEQGAPVTLLSERLTEAFAEPFSLAGREVSVSASIGVAVGSAPQRPDELLLAADAAMYDAKRHGGDCVRMFHPELRAAARDRFEVELDLRRAVDRGELVVLYQPVVDLGTGQPVAVEALVRWQHPVRGLLLPEQFLSVAEQSGLIVAVGRFVLEQACQDVARTGSAEGLDVNVNLSARQLTRPVTVGQVRAALRSSGLAAERLVLEVTESTAVEAQQAAVVALEELCRLGVRLAVNDFGTGNGPLLSPRSYRVQVVKIDRRHVAGMAGGMAGAALCAGVVNLERAVGAISVAEGVETVEQYAALRTLGCERGQGFLWSPAVPVDRLAAALQRCREVMVPAPVRSPSPAAVPVDVETVRRIAALHRAGVSVHTIAAALNSDRVRSGGDVQWTAAAVARHLSG